MLELIEARDLNGLYVFIAIRAFIIIVCWAMMITSCLIDLWSGRNAAKFLGERLESHKYRRTIIKIGDYSRVMLFGFMFDCLGMLLPFFILPFSTMLCTISVMAIEGKSVLENSARKKAHAAEIPEMIKSIIQATTQKEAEVIFNKLTSK